MAMHPLFRIVLAVPLVGAMALTAALAGPGKLEERLFLHEGYRCFKGGEYTKARDYFTRACELNLSGAEARFALGDALAVLGQYQEAVTQLRHGLRLDSEWPVRDYPRFGMFGSQAELDRYLGRLRGQVTAVQKDVYVRILLGYNLFHMDQHVDAYDVFTQAEGLAPKDPVVKRYLKAIAGKGYTGPTASGDEEEKPPPKKEEPKPSPGGPGTVAGGPAGPGGMGGPGGPGGPSGLGGPGGPTGLGGPGGFGGPGGPSGLGGPGGPGGPSGLGGPGGPSGLGGPGGPGASASPGGPKKKP